MGICVDAVILTASILKSRMKSAMLYAPEIRRKNAEDFGGARFSQLVSSRLLSSKGSTQVNLFIKINLG